jgi:CubicO group peptidase (beta-lactamase class C family)
MPLTLRRLLVAAPIFFVVSAPAQVVPGRTWSVYQDPAHAGFDKAKLNEAKEDWSKANSAAFLVIYKGAILADWGETKRRFMCHSVRKSFMSGLFGIYVDNGTINLNKTLADMDIHDLEPDLTPAERKAKIVDLLSARSGVYRQAAYEPANAPKPERGAHDPGTFWNYNNWDFNTLYTIFEQETGRKAASAFAEYFAGPLQMEDFRERDVYEHYNLDKSIHPAYPFRMSARDMARFGLLYLNKGKWGSKQLLSAEWVERSTKPQPTTDRVMDYSYLWWNLKASPFKEWGTYLALGTGGQAIVVVPQHELVIVNRGDTYAGQQTDLNDLMKLVVKVVEAKTGAAMPNPRLVERPYTEPKKVHVNFNVARKYVGNYRVPSIQIRPENGELVLHDPMFGTFALEMISPTEFRLEDAQQPLFFELDGAGNPIGVVDENAMNTEAYRLLALKDYLGAIAVLEKALRFFPKSANLYDSLGEMFMKKGDKVKAIASYRKSLELNPTNENAKRMISQLSG